LIPDIKLPKQHNPIPNLYHHYFAGKMIYVIKQDGLSPGPFWGSYFGMCVDKFGISWMMSYDGGNKG